MDQGRFDEARRHADLVLRMAERADAKTVELWARWALGRLALHEGDAPPRWSTCCASRRSAPRRSGASRTSSCPTATSARRSCWRASARRPRGRPTGCAARARRWAAGSRRPPPRAPRRCSRPTTPSRSRSPARSSSCSTCRSPRARPHAAPARRAPPPRRPRRERARGAPARARGLRAPRRAPWAARAREELRLAGARQTVDRPRDPSEALTAQEWRVAQLVAQGLTNREVGRVALPQPEDDRAPPQRDLPQARGALADAARAAVRRRGPAARGLARQALAAPGRTSPDS